MYGNKNQALFNIPMGLDLAEDGTLYVADLGNHVIRKISNGQVSTLVDTAGSNGEINGPINSALLDTPKDVIFMSENLVYVLKINGEVRKIANDTVSTVDFVSNIFMSTRANAIDHDNKGNLFILDKAEANVFVLTPNGSLYN